MKDFIAVMDNDWFAFLFTAVTFTQNSLAIKTVDRRKLRQINSGVTMNKRGRCFWMNLCEMGTGTFVQKLLYT